MHSNLVTPTRRLCSRVGGVGCGGGGNVADRSALCNLLPAARTAPCPLPRHAAFPPLVPALSLLPLRHQPAWQARVGMRALLTAGRLGRGFTPAPLLGAAGQVPAPCTEPGPHYRCPVGVTLIAAQTMSPASRAVPHTPCPHFLPHLVSPPQRAPGSPAAGPSPCLWSAVPSGGRGPGDQSGVGPGITLAWAEANTLIDCRGKVHS